MVSPRGILLPIAGEGLIDNDSSSTVASVFNPKFKGRLSIADCLLKVTTAINSGLTSAPLINIYRHTVGPASVLNPTTGLVGISDFKNTPIVADDIAGTVLKCASIGRLGGETVSPGKPKTGTISVTASSATITGVGTLFTTEFAVGDVICTEGGQAVRVQAIGSATSITADRNFASSESAVKVYNTVPDPRDADDLANGWVYFDANDYIWAAISTEGSGGTVAGALQAIFAVEIDPAELSGHYLT